MSKTGRKNKKDSAEFKICVIMDMRENHLGYKETMRKYFPHLEDRNLEKRLDIIIERLIQETAEYKNNVKAFEEYYDEIEIC